MGVIGGDVRPIIAKMVSWILSILVVLIIVASISFLTFRMHDSHHILIPKGASPELISEMSDEYRLDDSLFEQYLSYLAHTFTGDYYRSVGMFFGGEIDSFIYSYASRTVFLLAIAATISVLLGWVWGRSSARRSRTLLGRLLHVSAAGFLSLPLIASILTLLRIVSDSGLDLPLLGDGFGEGLPSVVEHALIPLICLTAVGAGYFALVMRTGYLRAARFRDALASVGALPYYLIPLLVSGLTIVEMLYDYPGLLFLFINSGAFMYDAPVTMACFFLLSAISLFALMVLRLGLYLAVRAKSVPARSQSASMSPEESVPGSLTGRMPAPSLSRALAMSKNLIREFLRQRSATVALAIFMIMLVAGLLANFISVDQDPWSVPPSWDGTREILEPPSVDHPLGTDVLGRDVYSLDLYATRFDVFLVLSVAFVSVIMGLLVGYLRVLAHGRGRKSLRAVVGWFLATLRDLALAVPIVVLLIFATRMSSLKIVGFLGAVTLLCAFLWLWAWPLTGSVSAGRLALNDGVHRGRSRMFHVLRTSFDELRRSYLRVLSGTMTVTKFLVVIALVVSVAMSFMNGLTPPEFLSQSASWEELLWSGVVGGGFVTNWWLVYPVTVAITMLAICSYIILDALEKIFDRAAPQSSSGDDIVEEGVEAAPSVSGDSETASPNSGTGPPQ